jgi:ribosome-associated protein
MLAAPSICAVPAATKSAAAKSAPSPTLTSKALALRVAELISDMKGVDIKVLHLKPLTDMTDYFVIASGTSDTHVRSMAQHVVDELRQEGSRVHHAEGLEQGRWALLDFVDVVVHVFHPTLRGFYQLERLWSDAEELSVA